MAVQQTISLGVSAQSVETNTSSLRLIWRSSQTGSSGGQEAQARYEITVNDAAPQVHTFDCALTQKGTDTLLDTVLTVVHDVAGRCCVTVRTWLDTGTDGQITGEKTLTLPVIPRASRVTATSGNIGQSILLAISRHSTTFQHTLQYTFGGAAGWIGAGGKSSQSPVYHSGTSVAFTLPAGFYSQIPNDTFGVGKVTCHTYYGSTLIGTTETDFTAYAEETASRPSVTGTVEDCREDTLALTGDRNILVRHMSTALCRITATGKNGGVILTKKVGAAEITGDSVQLQRVATGNFTFTATDSRGYKSSFSVEKTLIPYIRLTNNASVRRTHPRNGNAELTLQGSFYNGSFGATDNYLSVSYTVDGGESRQLTVTPGEAEYQAVVALTDLDYREKHTLTVTVSDALETVTRTLTVEKGLPVFDWGEHDFAFHVPVESDESLSGAYIRRVRAWRRTVFRLQTKFTAFDGTDDRQSVFVFGGVLGRAVMGVVCVDGSGNCTWTGTEGVSITAEDAGVVKVSLGATAYDHLLAVSPEMIAIIT